MFLWRAPTWSSLGPGNLSLLPPLSSALQIRLLETMFPIITLLLNVWLFLLYFLLAWKSANTTLIPKPGKYSKSLDSYHPIFLILVLGELLELLLKDKIWDFGEERNINYQSQHSFRSHHSTQDVIFSLHNTADTAVNSLKIRSATVLDIQKSLTKSGMA